MNTKQTIEMIYQRKWLIFWLTLFGAFLSFALVVIQEPQYRASSRMLIIQKQTTGQDVYTISKSAQYITRVLQEGVYSDSFFNKILESPYDIKETDFSSEPKKRRSEWEKDIKIRTLRDLGIIEIDVFRSQKDKAEKINRAIMSILKENHRSYHGSGENVTVEILDYPLVSQKPVKPNLWLSLILGAIIGFLAGLGWVIEKPKNDNYSLGLM